MGRKLYCIGEMKMNKKVLFGLVALLGVSLISCATNGGNNDGDDAFTITDSVGREMTLVAGSYKKVVCIGAGALRLYSYVGDMNLLSGVEDIDNESLSSRPKMFDAVARPYVMANSTILNTLPSCGVGGPQAQTAEAEKILTCKPDIVISEYEDKDKADALSKQIGVPVFTVGYGTEGVFDTKVATSITNLGKIFDKVEKAKTLNKFISDSKEEISSKTSAIADSDKKNVYIGGLGNWGTTTYLTTAKNYEPFNVANIKNICDSQGNLIKDGTQTIEIEKFVSMGENIDIMILDAASIKNIKPLYKADNTIFDSCKAWNEGKVYLQMAYNAYYTNLEIALINTYYNAMVVYPEQFSGYNIETITDKVTKAFLGQELNDEIKAKTFSYGGYQQIDTKTFFA
jgi:iron complex transport system substrate-binding protein